MSIKGKKILVTGGTGFLGSRYVKRMLDEGAVVRVLTRTEEKVRKQFAGSVEVVEGDILDFSVVNSAVRDMEIVSHFVYGREGTHEQKADVTIEGTEILADAASAEKSISKFLYLSTITTYGEPPNGVLSEASPRKLWTDSPYASSKYKAEMLLKQKRGLPAIFIQPTVVYGPGGGAWTTTMLELVRDYQLVVAPYDNTTCYLLYVDDLLEALVAATRNDGLIGEDIILCSSEKIPWTEYFLEFSRANPKVEPKIFWKHDVFGSFKALQDPYDCLRLKYWRKFNARPEWRLPLPLASLSAATKEVCTEKAKRLLNFTPRFTFADGMQETVKWMKAEGLV